MRLACSASTLDLSLCLSVYLIYLYIYHFQDFSRAPLNYTCACKMNGYSKINPSSKTHKSRSMDFSDFFSFPQTPKPIRTTSTVIRPEGLDQIKKNKTQKSSPERRAEEEDDGDDGRDQHRDGERFGVILGRSASVSSSSSGFQATMKRAFSMRRSSSVSERYCRIHDQYMALASPIGEESGGDEVGGRRSVKKQHRGGKILRACKRLLGF